MGRADPAGRSGEADRQADLAVANAAALARNYVAAGYVCVLEGAIVRRSQVRACQRKVAPHPLYLIVLAPPAEVSERRDADRSGKHVAAWFRHLGPVLDRELAGLGLWIDNSRQSPLDTARMILTRRPGAPGCDLTVARARWTPGDHRLIWPGKPPASAPERKTGGPSQETGSWRNASRMP